MKAALAGATAFFILMVAVPAGAQERTRPDTVRAEVRQRTDSATRQQMMQMQQMMPMMTNMMHQVMESTMAALAEPQNARNLAKFTRGYYEALIEEGFSREDALRIVVSMGFPSMPRL